MHQAYFKGPHTCSVCGVEFELASELRRHERHHRDHSHSHSSSRRSNSHSHNHNDDRRRHTHSTQSGNTGAVAVKASTELVTAGAAAEPQDPASMPTVFDDHLDGLVFRCPTCNRSFDMLASCHSHAMARRHGEFCLYDASALPACWPMPAVARRGVQVVDAKGFPAVRVCCCVCVCV